MMTMWVLSVSDKGARTTYGAILTAEPVSGGGVEYIPIPLAQEEPEVVCKRLPQWFVEQLPDSFPTYGDYETAEFVLQRMYEAAQDGILTVDFVTALIAMTGGDMHDRAEYWYEVLPPDRAN